MKYLIRLIRLAIAQKRFNEASRRVRRNRRPFPNLRDLADLSIASRELYRLKYPDALIGPAW